MIIHCRVVKWQCTSAPHTAIRFPSSVSASMNVSPSIHQDFEHLRNTFSLSISLVYDIRCDRSAMADRHYVFEKSQACHAHRVTKIIHYWWTTVSTQVSPPSPQPMPHDEAPSGQFLYPLRFRYAPGKSSPTTYEKMIYICALKFRAPRSSGLQAVVYIPMVTTSLK